MSDCHDVVHVVDNCRDPKRSPGNAAEEEHGTRPVPPAAPEAPKTQEKTPLATKNNTRRVKWGTPFATPAAPEAPRTQEKTPLATKSNTRRVKWAFPSRLRHQEDPSESPSATEVDEGEEQEDPDGTDADIHKEGPERRTPARAIEPEHAAIAEDVGEHEERVTEVEAEEHGEDFRERA